MTWVPCLGGRLLWVFLLGGLGGLGFFLQLKVLFGGVYLLVLGASTPKKTAFWLVLHTLNPRKGCVLLGFRGY